MKSYFLYKTILMAIQVERQLAGDHSKTLLGNLWRLLGQQFYWLTLNQKRENTESNATTLIN